MAIPLLLARYDAVAAKQFHNRCRPPRVCGRRLEMTVGGCCCAAAATDAAAAAAHERLI